MKKKIMAMLAATLFCATSYLNCAVTTVAADSKGEDSSSATTLFMGDVNDDGSFNVADVVLFQKWLWGVSDAELINWRASDFCWDNRLNVFDLALMKRALLEKMNIDPNDDPEIYDIKGTMKVESPNAFFYGGFAVPKPAVFSEKEGEDIFDFVIKKAGGES